MHCPRLTAVLFVTLAGVATTRAAPVVTVDPVSTNTLIFRDYNGTSDSGVSYNPAPAPSQSLANGTSAWSYAAAVGDPKIIYNDGAGAWDHAVFPWARFRFQQSRTTGGAVQYWENPARGGEGSSLGTAAALTEVSRDTPNPAPDGTGFRIDPFAGTQIGDAFWLDYVLLDTFETLGFAEWDAVGDPQGWTTPNVSGVTVTNSAISGTAATGDAQVTSGTQQFDADVYNYVEIRMKGSAGPIQLFWALNGAYTGGQAVGLGVNDGQWHTYVLDFTQEGTWTGTNMRLRLDPNNDVGQTFEIDYIRIRKNAYGVGNTFTGTVNTDWNTAGNWSLARVPANGDQPVVTGHTAVVSANVPGVGATTIGNGGNVQVTAGGSLTVDGDISVGSAGAGSLTVDGGALNWSGKLWSLSGNGAITISGTSATVTGTRNDGAGGIEIQNGASLNFVMGTAGVSPVTLSGNALAALAASSVLTVDGSAYAGATGKVTLITHNGYAGVGTFSTVTITGFGGMTGAVEYAAGAVNLVLSYRDAVPVANPSFEIDALALPAPGYGAITSWAWAGLGNRGVNPAAGGGAAFANNGAVPDRKAVAFIQGGPGGISQTLNGLDTNSTYWLQLWYNARTHAEPTDPQVKVEFAGAVVMDWTDNAPVGGANPYHYTNIVFTPAAHGGALTLSSRNTSGDQTSLFDAICVVRRDEYQVPIKNPGFEASGTPGWPGYISNSGERIAGWTMLGGDNIGINDQSLPFYDNGQNPDGSYVCLLQRGVKSISQQVNGLVPGQEYELSYAFNARGDINEHAHLKVTVGAFTVQDSDVPRVTVPGDYSVPFHTTNFSFTANASSMTLKFESTRNDADNTALVDDVRLAAIPSQGTLFILR